MQLQGMYEKIQTLELLYLAEKCETLLVFWWMSRVLPVQIQTIKVMSSQEFDGGLDECLTVCCCGHHCGEAGMTQRIKQVTLHSENHSTKHQIEYSRCYGTNTTYIVLLSHSELYKWLINGFQKELARDSLTGIHHLSL